MGETWWQKHPLFHAQTVLRRKRVNIWFQSSKQEHTYYQRSVGTRLHMDFKTKVGSLIVPISTPFIWFILGKLRFQLFLFVSPINSCHIFVTCKLSIQIWKKPGLWDSIQSHIMCVDGKMDLFLIVANKLSNLHQSMWSI